MGNRQSEHCDKINETYTYYQVIPASEESMNSSLGYSGLQPVTITLPKRSRQLLQEIHQLERELGF